MKWTWQLDDFPNFRFDESLFVESERLYHQNVGRISGAITGLNKDQLPQLQVEILSNEAVFTSNIEGEVLDRASVQSSIQRHLGISARKTNAGAREAGIANLMSDVYLNFKDQLNEEMLCSWHSMITNGRIDLDIKGDFRKHKEPMQIVSGNLSNPKVFYEAPPSKYIVREITRFIEWYNTSLINHSIPTLVFAGIAHLYFEILHPFEDGNGRIGRALVEKALSQRNGKPSLNSFSKTISNNKKAYYSALQKCNTTLEITSWLIYFCQTVIEAQNYTFDLTNFVVRKNKFYYHYSDLLNERHFKVINKMFEAGLEGFIGGLSSSNYQSITKTSPATATRDLSYLVDIGAFIQKGQLKSSRYFLRLG